MLASLGNYLAYFGTTLGLLILAVFVYVGILPYDEIALVRRGNVAAAVALAGTLIGYAVVVYSATIHGVSLLETAMWSAISLVVQIVAFEIVNFSVSDFKAGMEKGELSYGVVLGAFSIAVGIINAGCITP